MLQVIEQAFADFGRQRQEAVFAVLRGAEENLIVGPPNVLQLKKTHLATAHTIRVEQLQNGIVAATDGRTAIHSLKDGLCLRFIESPRHSGQFVRAQCRHCTVKAVLDMSLMDAESQERA